MQKLKLNLGCGRDYRHGYINSDISPILKTDIVFNFQKGIPYPNDYFDEILANNVLTQIMDSKDFIFVMNELWRVTKHKGVLIIRVPLVPYENAFRDPMDCRRFTKNSFDYLVGVTRRYGIYGKHYGFKSWNLLGKDIEIRNDFDELWGSMVIKLQPRGRVKQTPPFLGKKHKSETKIKQSLAQKGENGSNWQGGKTAERDLIRSSSQYKEWRTLVFQRDNYTCTKCGARSGIGETVILNADHIQPFSKFPELRFLVSNGRTLCLKCHKKTETYGAKINKKIK